jgi:hypothetical protein
MKLGELLLNQRLVSREQLDEALRTQAFFGARLGTNLVELGFVKFESLTAALAQQLGIPGAQKPHFDAIKPGAIHLLPRKFAEKYCCLPLGLAKGSEHTLVVAFREPRELAAIDEVAFATGKRISPAIAPELRLYYYLEKYYGIRRKSRYLRLQSNTGGTDAVRRPIPGSAIDVFAPPVMTASRAPVSAPVPAAEAPVLGPDVPDGDINIAAVLGEATTQPAISPARPVPEQAPRPHRPTGPIAVLPVSLDVDEAATRMDEAQARDEIGDAMVGFLRSAFECGLVLITKDELALGWKGFGPPEVDPGVIEGIALPLKGASMLRSAYDTRAPFVGSPPAEGATLQARLWKLLKLAQPPEQVLIAPIVLKDRVVNLVYAHPRDGIKVALDLVESLVGLAQVAAQGYLRLIQRTKHKG